jgi:hypothetical protein
MRKPLGYTLLIISCIAWGVLPLIPFIPWEPEELAALAGGVFIFAEITWWLAMPLLGKEVYELMNKLWLKTKLQLGKQKK